MKRMILIIGSMLPILSFGQLIDGFNAFQTQAIGTMRSLQAQIVLLVSLVRAMLQTP
ncbi:hypothetical protein Ct9H90mP12_2340 [bacterium]|nr:MAG: hypothetical protein Ct9H90mP12_2340 [bacterium]